MGVTGLWRLIEPTGKPVPVETLENKVLAVDISIWLHQVVKGYQDAKGAPLPNAHLMGLFQRLCKLLYFRIKPIFVFDGGFPDLKKETIAKRQDHRAKYNSDSARIKRELMLLLSKKTAVSSFLGKQISPKKNTSDANNDDIFKLPALPQLEEEEIESESEDESSSSSLVDLHSVDLESENFKSLPVKEKYDLLIELKETRKMNSWGRLHELPKKSDNFSTFQVERLLKRRKVQECLQETEKEMGDSGMSLNDLESLLNETGIDTKLESLPTRRIASNKDTRFLLINNVKQALAKAKLKNEVNKQKTDDVNAEPMVRNSDAQVDIKELKTEEDNTEATVSKVGSKELKDEINSESTKKNTAESTPTVNVRNKDELEEELKKAIALSLQECGDEDKNTSACSKTDESQNSALSDSELSEFSDSEGDTFAAPDNMSSAKAYITQYTDFTEKAIEKMFGIHKSKTKKASATPDVEQVLNELKKEKFVLDNVELSSSEDESETAMKKIELAKNVDAERALVASTSKKINNLQGFKRQESSDMDYSDEDLQRAIKASIKGFDSQDSDSDVDDLEEVPNVNTEPNKMLENFLNVAEASKGIPSSVSAKKGEIKIVAEVVEKPVATEQISISVTIPEVATVNLDGKEDIKQLETSKKDSAEEQDALYDKGFLKDDLQRAIELSLQSADKDIDPKDSDSSDGDFEEVLTVDAVPKKNIEILLNVGQAPEDDIFADVFDGEPSGKAAEVANIVKQSVSPDKVTVVNNKAYQISAVDYAEASTSKAGAFEVFEDIDIINHNETCKDLAVAEPNLPVEVIKVMKQSDQEIKQEVLSQEPINDINNQKEKVDEAGSNKTNSTEKPIENEQLKKMEADKNENEAEAQKQDILKENRLKAETEQMITEKVVNDNSRLSAKTEIAESIKNQTPKMLVTAEQLNTMAEELQNEEQELLHEKGRLDRIGRNITEQMTKDAQELLQIFGIPYIVAPMEAEAQCAFLELVKLTDGTITDDSDIWLFGGRTVYKNFFNHKKHVLQFLAERIEKSFNLTREQLILLALLVGSDYTTGVSGVGPVTALEILASFPFNKKHLLGDASKQAQYAHIVEGLQEFKKWVRAGKRTDNVKLKNKLKNVKFTEDFPSCRVVQAYLEPNVEKSEDKFTWGELDITILRDYTKAKFGWSQSKLDEIINPVLKRMLDRKTQKSVQDYFKRKIEFQNLEDQMSKRVKAAVQKMGPEGLIEEKNTVEDLPDNKIKQTRKRKIAKNTEQVTDSGKPSVPKMKKSAEDAILDKHCVKVVSQFTQDGQSGIDIKIPKSDRVQEIIPQREKDKQNLLENKLKAIEIFRKTKLDRKKKTMKRRPNLPKDKANLSESSDSD